MIKNHRHIVFLISFLAFFGFFNTAEAMTTSELQVKISELQAQIAQLQKQLTAQEEAQTAWCHDFDADLKRGMSGIEIGALQKALEKQGFYKKGNNPASFEEGLFTAVTDFQEKYEDEILKIYDLKLGTGYVGVYTRAKLNKLYGCSSGAATSSITVLSPNGGEKLEAGKTYDIKWNVSGTVDKVIIYLYDFTGTVGTGILAYDVVSPDGRYSWTIPSDIGSGSKLAIAVRDSISQLQVYDMSDDYFSITNVGKATIK